MRLQVYRVQVNEVAETTAIAVRARSRPRTPNAFVGERTVTTPGVDGQQVTRYRVTVVDGVETGREVLDSTVTVAPVTEQVTRRHQAAADRSRPTADGLNWAALAQCESGGNPRAVNPAGYYGLYQFSLSTWRVRRRLGQPDRRLPGRADRPGADAVQQGRRRPVGLRPPPVRLIGPSLSTPPEQSDGLLGPAAIRELAQQLDLRPTKTLGQNFLHDANTIRRIVRTADLRPDDVVLEVGPGPRLAHPRAAAGGRPRRRRRDRPAAGRPAARSPSPRAAPTWPTG